VSSPSRVHGWVEGRVQGVFYRGSCARAASQRGVHGWVTNLADGRVEAVFEGDPLEVAALVEWCRRGPPGALVTNLVAREEPVAGESAFRVR
jgi:acylphosphatase